MGAARSAQLQIRRYFQNIAYLKVGSCLLILFPSSNSLANHPGEKHEGCHLWKGKGGQACSFDFVHF